jgi:hypothetical protein
LRAELWGIFTVDARVYLWYNVKQRRVIKIDGLKIEDLRKLCEEDNIVWTTHITMRLQERGIFPTDIISCITNGEIIEQYPNDYPNPSCLILGKNSKDEYIHSVIGSNGEKLWFITAYYPTLDKFESDLKTRKAVK